MNAGSPVFETERLLVREWSLDDVEDAYRIYGDAEVLRYLGPGNIPPDPDLERTRALMSRRVERSATQANGLGIWAVEERDTGRAVGAVGLAVLGDGPDIEILWHFARDVWGRGYATESAAAALAHAYGPLDLARIVAIVYPQNGASLRVCEKIGLRRDGEREFFGKQLAFFVGERA